MSATRPRRAADDPARRADLAAARSARPRRSPGCSARLFCAITVAIVIYMLVQGVKYVRPELFVTHPAPGFDEADTGGFLDPLIGTFVVGGMAMAIAAAARRRGSACG